MVSDKRKEQLRLALEIQNHNTESDIPCDFCFENNRKCYVMASNDRRLKCSECVRKGRPCVNLSWESLDRTREEYQKKVDADEKLLAEVISRLIRNKAILAQAKDRAHKKAECLANELEEGGENVRAEEINCPAADAQVAFSPAMWSTLGYIDEATSRGIDPVVLGS
jgi:hypothetical protein